MTGQEIRSESDRMGPGLVAGVLGMFGGLGAGRRSLEGCLCCFCPGLMGNVLPDRRPGK